MPRCLFPFLGSSLNSRFCQIYFPSESFESLLNETAGCQGWDWHSAMHGLYSSSWERTWHKKGLPRATVVAFLGEWRHPQQWEETPRVPADGWRLGNGRRNYNPPPGQASGSFLVPMRPPCFVSTPGSGLQNVPEPSLGWREICGEGKLAQLQMS